MDYDDESEDDFMKFKTLDAFDIKGANDLFDAGWEPWGGVELAGYVTATQPVYIRTFVKDPNNNIIKHAPPGHVVVMKNH